MRCADADPVGGAEFGPFTVKRLLVSGSAAVAFVEIFGAFSCMGGGRFLPPPAGTGTRRVGSGWGGGGGWATSSWSALKCVSCGRGAREQVSDHVRGTSFEKCGASTQRPRKTLVNDENANENDEGNGGGDGWDWKEFPGFELHPPPPAAYLIAANPESRL